MNPERLATSARNILSAVEIKFNRLMGRQLIPVHRDLLYIETSSVCNLKCRFCAYVKKQSPRVSMKDAFFKDCVTQAVDMGYRRFELTPCTGDIFMDHHIFNKLEFLEANPDATAYQFFTNFTIPKPRDIERLARLQKLSQLAISIYGHDLPSFIAITESTEKMYERLITNLQVLFGLLKQTKFTLAFCFRSTNRASRSATSELMRLLKRFERAGIAIHSTRLYNNWGGYISQADVEGLGIDIRGADDIYKSGACVHLFTTVQVMATGIVNGCACRDVDTTLRIGDLNETPLRQILSSRNASYMSLIEEQERGEFRPICRSCDYYKSIYHMRSTYRKDRVQLQSVEEFKTRLDGGQSGDRASATPS
jgi:sulfatase maturation enzyme AslB (radical SAM superfamily)